MFDAYKFCGSSACIVNKLDHCFVMQAWWAEFCESIQREQMGHVVPWYLSAIYARISRSHHT